MVVDEDGDRLSFSYDKETFEASKYIILNQKLGNYDLFVEYDLDNFMELKEKVIEEIKKIYDPEIPVNIYELGLIYDIAVDKKNISVKMTLTTPNCPVAESLPKEVKDSIMQLEEVDKVDLDLVWEPPWDKSMMSEAAKLELNL